MKQIIALFVFVAVAAFAEEQEAVKPPRPPEEVAATVAVVESKPAQTDERFERAKLGEATANAAAVERQKRDAESGVKKKKKAATAAPVGSLKLEDGSVGEVRADLVPSVPRRGGVVRAMQIDDAKAARQIARSQPSIAVNQVKIFNVVDATNMIIEWHDDATMIWVAGKSTAGLVDGGQVYLDGVFRYAGTKQYRTVIGGASTVHKIEAVNP